MRKALIGFSGFVGSNLAAQEKFDDLYNSSNIQEIAGREYDLVVSAGARAEKWRINREPEEDLAEINSLIDYIGEVTTKRFVLISTVDVYKNPVGVNEDTVIDTDGLQPYGANRYHLEQFAESEFNTLTVRLPGLFGPGLKKNVIYDLLHDNHVDKIHHAGSFQYYNLENIWQDIQTALAADIKLINFATEPVRTDEIADHCFGLNNFSNEPDGVAAGSYDMHTKHAKLYSRQGNYIYSKRQVLDDIKMFVQIEKEKSL